MPLEVYDGKEQITGCRFVKDGIGEMVIPITNPDLVYFSELEIEIMERLIDIFAKRWVTTGTMSDATHEDILCWKRTERNKMIDLALEFEGNLLG